MTKTLQKSKYELCAGFSTMLQTGHFKMKRKYRTHPCCLVWCFSYEDL